jgi:FtsP/CotA-like multicopper oxidase with cupredoxin domain
MRASRRTVLAGAASTALLAVAPWRGAVAASLGPAPVELVAERRVIDVRGRAATVTGLRQPDGTHGLRIGAADRFRVALINRLNEPTLIHWHGLRSPVAQDGMPGISQPVLQPGGAYAYDFALRDWGTYWMHAHHALQEQQLLAAPLIIADPDPVDEQEVVLMLHDFSFRAPEEILASLPMSAWGITKAILSSVIGGQSGHGHRGGAHVNDVEFDAYLANDRTLADPQAVQVERGARLRLRVINGASSTNFAIDLGALEGELIAVDGRPVQPVAGRRFGIAMSQRLDLRLRVPGSGAFPVLAVREGDRQATGIVLHTPGAAVQRVSEAVADAVPPLSLAEEERLRALQPLEQRPTDRRMRIALTGDMMEYGWGFDGSSPDEMREYAVKPGERVEITLDNDTNMSHPVHLHGHRFQVVGSGSRRFAGAVRDTVLVPAGSSVTLALDADNPGSWMLHCHNLYHMAAGMMALLRYV